MRPGDWGQRLGAQGGDEIGQVLNAEEWISARGATRKYVVRWGDGSIEVVPDSALVYVRAGADPKVTITMPRAVWLDVISAIYVAEGEGQGGGPECTKPIIEALGLGLEYQSWVRPW